MTTDIATCPTPWCIEKPHTNLYSSCAGKSVIVGTVCVIPIRYRHSRDDYVLIDAAAVHPVAARRLADTFAKFGQVELAEAIRQAASLLTEEQR